MTLLTRSAGREAWAAVAGMLAAFALGAGLAAAWGRWEEGRE